MTVLMAAHVLSFKNQSEFFDKIKNKDSDLVLKMVKTILWAIKNKKLKIEIFQVVFSESKEITFSLERKEYLKTLNLQMPKLIELEEYELCSQIQKINEKRQKRRKNN